MRIIQAVIAASMLVPAVSMAMPERITNIDEVMEFNRQAENHRLFGFRMVAVGFLMNNYPCK